MVNQSLFTLKELSELSGLPEELLEKLSKSQGLHKNGGLSFSVGNQSLDDFIKNRVEKGYQIEDIKKELAGLNWTIIK